MKYPFASLYTITFCLLNVLDLNSGGGPHDPSELSKSEKKTTQLVPRSVENLLLRGGTEQWTYTFSWSGKEMPHCHVGRWKVIRMKHYPIKHELFAEKYIEIFKDKGVYEDHDVKFIFPNDMNRQTEKISMLKCTCSITQDYPASPKSSDDEGENQKSASVGVIPEQHTGNPDLASRSNVKHDETSTSNLGGTPDEIGDENVVLKTDISSSSPDHQSTSDETLTADIVKAEIHHDKQRSNKSVHGNDIEQKKTETIDSDGSRSLNKGIEDKEFQNFKNISLEHLVSDSNKLKSWKNEELHPVPTDSPPHPDREDVSSDKREGSKDNGSSSEGDQIKESSESNSVMKKEDKEIIAEEEHDRSITEDKNFEPQEKIDHKDDSTSEPSSPKKSDGNIFERLEEKIDQIFSSEEKDRSDRKNVEDEKTKHSLSNAGNMIAQTEVELEESEKYSLNRNKEEVQKDDVEQRNWATDSENYRDKLTISHGIHETRDSSSLEENHIEQSETIIREEDKEIIAEEEHDRSITEDKNFEQQEKIDHKDDSTSEPSSPKKSDGNIFERLEEKIDQIFSSEEKDRSDRKNVEDEKTKHSLSNAGNMIAQTEVELEESEKYSLNRNKEEVQKDDVEQRNWATDSENYRDKLTISHGIHETRDSSSLEENHIEQSETIIREEDKEIIAEEEHDRSITEDKNFEQQEKIDHKDDSTSEPSSPKKSDGNIFERLEEKIDQIFSSEEKHKSDKKNVEDEKTKHSLSNEGNMITQTEVELEESEKYSLNQINEEVKNDAAMQSTWAAGTDSYDEMESKIFRVELDAKNTDEHAINTEIKDISPEGMTQNIRTKNLEEALKQKKSEELNKSDKSLNREEKETSSSSSSSSSSPSESDGSGEKTDEFSKEGAKSKNEMNSNAKGESNGEEDRPTVEEDDEFKKQKNEEQYEEEKTESYLEKSDMSETIVDEKLKDKSLKSNSNEDESGEGIHHEAKSLTKITESDTREERHASDGHRLYRRNPLDLQLEYDFARLVPADSICVDDGAGKRSVYLSKGLYGDNSFFVYGKNGSIFHAIAYLVLD